MIKVSKCVEAKLTNFASDKYNYEIDNEQYKIIEPQGKFTTPDFMIVIVEGDRGRYLIDMTSKFYIGEDDFLFECVQAYRDACE